MDTQITQNPSVIKNEDAADKPATPETPDPEKK